jgi:2-oxoacid:acceptor oxidoreductase delta subunit (pyruvate/2-ketoisovalerate family)
VQRLADDALHAEGTRCFQCGDCNSCGNCWAFCPDMAVQPAPGVDGANGLRRYEIDERFCKGCGVCAQECPRGAIVMEEEVR